MSKSTIVDHSTGHAQPAFTRDFCGFRAHRRRGGALVMAMLVVCVLSVVASSMLLLTTTRYHTTYQSASWREAMVGAEAGVDIAMSELRKRVVNGPGSAFKTAAQNAKSNSAVAGSWTTNNPDGSGSYKNYGRAFPADNQPYTLPGPDGSATRTHGDEGNTVLQARVYVDVPGSDVTPTTANFAVPADNGSNSFISQLDNPNLRDPDGVDRSRWWYRIRSLGIAGVSGPARPNLEKLDNRLRRFSLFNDWRTGDAVPAPQVARLVEVLARPEMNFRNALMADKQIDLDHEDVLVDSYDSSKGNYSSTNNGTMGNIATNGKLINANNATVRGNAMTNNGNVTDGGNVSGQQSNSFYQELTPFTNGQLNPAWSSVQDGGTVTSDTTYKASADANNPTRVRLDGINLAAGGNTVSITAPDGATSSTPSYIKLYVQGNISTNNDSFISLDPGVNAIVYFTGDVNLQGLGIFNTSMLANHLVLNGIQPTANGDGSYPARSISIATTQDFEGIVYAPNHDVNLALKAASPGSGGSSSAQDLAKQLAKLQDDQNKAIADWNKDLAKYQRDMASAGLIAPPLPLVVATYASDLSYLPAPNGQLTSDVAKLQKSLNKVAQTQVQILNLQGTLTPSQQDDHARGYNGIYGGFVARTITVAEKTHIHYDETLRTAGPVNHYEIVNWFEDNASRTATGGSSPFWWAKAK